MNPCKNKTHKKYKKKFKSEDISPTTDWSRYDKKNYNQGLLEITCLIKKTTESRKKMNNLSIRDFLCFILQLFFLLKLKYREIVMKEL